MKYIIVMIIGEKVMTGSVTPTGSLFTNRLFDSPSDSASVDNSARLNGFSSRLFGDSTASASSPSETRDRMGIISSRAFSDLEDSPDRSPSRDKRKRKSQGARGGGDRSESRSPVRSFAASSTPPRGNSIASPSTPPRGSRFLVEYADSPESKISGPRPWVEFSPRACSLVENYRPEAFLRQHPGPKALSSVRESYIEETKDSKIENKQAFAEFFSSMVPAVPSTDKVQYLARSSRDELEVSFEGAEGRTQLIWKGKPLSKDFHRDPETRRLDEDLNGPMIFILSKKHKMYCHGDILRGINAPHFHHSSFDCGKDVCFAGGMETDENGFLTSISNESGHYLPDDRSAAFALEYLQSKGVDLSQVTYKSVIGNDEYNESNALEFLEKMKNEKV
ncbi:MAG: hypothetical protein ACI9S8_000795 [Chlamydiales bacterium]